jgi:hypothetical protein
MMLAAAVMTEGLVMSNGVVSAAQVRDASPLNTFRRPTVL